MNRLDCSFTFQPHPQSAKTRNLLEMLFLHPDSLKESIGPSLQADERVALRGRDEKHWIDTKSSSGQARPEHLQCLLKQLPITNDLAQLLQM